MRWLLLHDVGKASSNERHRRWPMVSGKDVVNGRRCVAGDNAISIMTYRSGARAAPEKADAAARSRAQRSR